METSHERPKVGIGVMIFKDGKVLLGKRKKTSHGSGEYCFPGGHLEFMESAVGCAKRETMEECGIEIQNVWFRLAANVRKYGKHHVLLGFVADWKRGEPKTLEPEKNESWNWYALNQLPKPLFEGTKLMIENYEGDTHFLD